MNNNLEFENEDPEPYEDSPRTNYGAMYDNGEENTSILNRFNEAEKQLIVKIFEKNILIKIQK